MATIDIAGRFRQPTWHGLAGVLRGTWRAFLRRREERRTLAALSRLEPRALRDIGFDPEQVHEALGGRFDVLPVNRSLLPKDRYL
jgi:uncharacterized protein YjiS (DUF1127 family)